MGVTQRLAATISAIGFDTLPQEVVDRTVQAIADGIAVAVAGCDQVPVTLMAKHARRLGSKPVCSVWGLGFRTSPVFAAYINGMATHVLDFEPMWSPPTHAVSPTVPVAFALAEERGLGGREIIAAVAKGMEIQSRLQFAADQYEPEHLRFHPPGVAGVLGAAVTAAHLLQLSELQLRNALGIAASRCGSILANVGTMTKSTHCGGAGAAGLDAALLAELGFTANADVIEAPKGLATTFYTDGFDEARLLSYGKPWRVVDPGLAIKLYPSQYATHFAISAALDLRRQIGSPDKLSHLRITSPVMHYVDRSSPVTGVDGKFSLQYTAAAALLDGQVTIDSFTDERRFRPDMRFMLERISLNQDPKIAGDWRTMRVEIEAETIDGRSYIAVSHGPRGCWGQEPVTSEHHRHKLIDCLGRIFSARDTERMLGSIQELPRTSPAKLFKLIQLLSARPRKKVSTASRRRSKSPRLHQRQGRS